MKFLLAILSVAFAYFICSGQLISAEAKEKTKTWCVAKPSASGAELTSNINYACSTLKLKNCTRIIELGGPCNEPNTLINHASVVMNLYYSENGKNVWNCDFKNTGLITISNPSYGNCNYDQ